MANGEEITLIKAKISRPPVRADMVPRPRLIEQLNRGLDCPLTLVCAGAGFGKTTLVSAWVDELLAPDQPSPAPLVAWLSLDEHDSDLHHFLRYFTAAVRTVVPMACAETLALLEARLEIPRAQLLATIHNDLFLLPQKTVIVLDDYYTLTDATVHEFLNELLHHHPPSLHLVLISRYTPPLPIAGLRARGDVIEVRNNDLRFTFDEIAEYVRRVWPTSLGRPGMEILEQKTEGWIAGLQLAGLSLRLTDNLDTALEALSGSNTEIAEYMTDEVLSRQPQTFLTFLLKTSILDRFNVSLCEAIGANDDPDWNSEAILDWLVHGNPFVSPLDNNREWYRFHPLFRDLLQQRLFARFGRNEVADLYRRAANWFAERGLLDIAIYHALKAQDLNLAAALMEKDLPAVLNREDRQTLEHWLRLLPEEFIERRPGLLLIQAWANYFAWHLEAVSRVVQKVEALLEQDDQATYYADNKQILQGQIAVLKAQEAFFKGRPDLSITYARETLAHIPSSWKHTRGGVMLYLALSMQAVGESAAIENQLLELYAPLKDKTDAYALRLLMSLCLIYTQDGRLEQVEQTAGQLLRQATKSKLVVLQGWAHFFLGLANYQWNHLDLAGQHFEKIIARRYQVHSLTARQGFSGSARVHLAAGRYDEALNVVEQLGQFDLAFDGRLTNVTQSLRASLSLATGNSEEANRWAQTFTTSATPIQFVLLELPQYTRAQILLTSRQREDVKLAQRILEELCVQAESNHNTRRKIEFLAAGALALDAQGKIPAARSNLQQAVKLARSGGFIRVFVDLGSQMRDLLTTLSGPSIYSEYIQHLLGAFSADQAGANGSKPAYPAGPARPVSNVSPETPELVESLTMREVQILKLLREPLSTQEIARKLDISHSTVKRHSINLYGKLGVHSRWDAVARAESLGILAPR